MSTITLLLCNLFMNDIRIVLITNMQPLKALERKMLALKTWCCFMR